MTAALAIAVGIGWVKRLIFVAWRDVEGVMLGFGAWTEKGNYTYNEYILYV